MNNINLPNTAEIKKSFKVFFEAVLQLFSNISIKLSNQEILIAKRELLNITMMQWITKIIQRSASQKIYSLTERGFDKNTFYLHNQNEVFQSLYDTFLNYSNEEKDQKNKLTKLIKSPNLSLNLDEFPFDELQNLILEIFDLKIENLDPIKNELATLKSKVLDEETYKELVACQNDMSKLINHVDIILEKLNSEKLISSNSVNEKLDIKINQLYFIKSNAETIKSGKPKSALSECKANLDAFFNQSLNTKKHLELLDKIKNVNLGFSSKMDKLDLLLIDFGLNIESIQEIHTLILK